MKCDSTMQTQQRTQNVMPCGYLHSTDDDIFYPPCCLIIDKQCSCVDLVLKSHSCVPPESVLLFLQLPKLNKIFHQSWSSGAKCLSSLSVKLASTQLDLQFLSHHRQYRHHLEPGLETVSVHAQCPVHSDQVGIEESVEKALMEQQPPRWALRARLHSVS